MKLIFGILAILFCILAFFSFLFVLMLIFRNNRDFEEISVFSTYALVLHVFALFSCLAYFRWDILFSSI